MFVKRRDCHLPRCEGVRPDAEHRKPRPVAINRAATRVQPFAMRAQIPPRSGRALRDRRRIFPRLSLRDDHPLPRGRGLPAGDVGALHQREYVIRLELDPLPRRGHELSIAIAAQLHDRRAVVFHARSPAPCVTRGDVREQPAMAIVTTPDPRRGCRRARRSSYAGRLADPRSRPNTPVRRAARDDRRTDTRPR